MMEVLLIQRLLNPQYWIKSLQYHQFSQAFDNVDFIYEATLK